MLELLIAYRYLFLFFGMLVAGEVVLVPAVYFVLQGELSLALVYSVSLTATLLSDTAWYLVGRFYHLERLKTGKWFQSHRSKVDGVQRLMDSYGLRLLFVSKFIYGSRILMQIVSGSSKLPYISYLAVNALAATIWFTFIYGMGRVFQQSLASFENAFYQNQVLFAILIVFIVLVHLCVTKIVQKKWSARSSRLSTKNKPSDRL